MRESRTVAQRLLSAEQLSAFDYRQFSDYQVRHFDKMVRPRMGAIDRAVVDVGGGVGHFARALAHLTKARVRVLDNDPNAVARCNAFDAVRVTAEVGDALAPTIRGDEAVVAFNLVLHHLVGSSEAATKSMQQDALRVWLNHCEYVFVSEYCYESYFKNLSGWLIYRITKSKLLSAIARIVGHVIPSLRANTLGVGVRFRSEADWKMQFANVGYECIDIAYASPDQVALPLRLLAIRAIVKTSFLLAPKTH